MPKNTIQVAIALIFNSSTGELLICRRKPDAVLGGYWEFPGGKCLPEEPPAACALRETLEETGLIIRILSPLATIGHDYPHARVLLHPFLCELVGGTLQLLAIAEARWIDPATIRAFRFPEANTPLLERAALGWKSLTEAALIQPG